MNLSTFELKPSNRYFVGTITMILAFITMLGPFSIDTYLPAINQMKEDLHATEHLVELVLSMYLIGYAFGQFFGGYIADTYGRKKTAVLGLTIYFITTLIITYQTQVYTIITLRAVQALGGGFTTVVCMAIARDLFEGRELARRLSLITMIMLCAPLIAPILGTYLTFTYGWRSIFAFLYTYSAVMLLVVVLFIPHTHIGRTTLPPWKVLRIVVSNRDAMANILTGAFSFAAVFSFITDANFFYIDFYKKEAELFPYYFGFSVFFMILSSALNAKIVKWLGMSRIVKPALTLQLLCALLLTMSYLWIPHDFHLSLTLITVFICMNGFIYGNASAAALTHFSDLSASAAAVAGLIRSGTGGLISVLLTIVHTNTPLSMSAIMLGCSVLAVAIYFFMREK